MPVLGMEVIQIDFSFPVTPAQERHPGPDPGPGSSSYKFSLDSGFLLRKEASVFAQKLPSTQRSFDVTS